MLKKISNLFFMLFFGCLLATFLLLCVHIYWGDKSYDAGRSFYPAHSEFLNPDASDFSFAVVSDTGADDIVLETMLDEIVETKPRYDFILHQVHPLFKHCVIYFMISQRVSRDVICLFRLSIS